MIRVDRPCLKFIKDGTDPAELKRNYHWLASEVNEVHDAIRACNDVEDEHSYEYNKAAEHLAEELADVIMLAYTMLYGLGRGVDILPPDEYCQAAIDKVRLKDLMRGSLEE